MAFSEHKFQARNFGQLRIFCGYQVCQETVRRITKLYLHFQLKSKGKGKTKYFKKEYHSKISKQFPKNKNMPIIVSFDGF